MRGMAQPSVPRKSTGRPPRISLSEILDAARRIVDEDGVDRLTMRRLASELGSAPMAVYHHVRNKDELLVMLLDDYAAQNLRRFEPPERARDRVLSGADAIHEALVGCPWIVEVLTADDLLSTSALWFVEQIVDGLVQAGLTLDQAVRGYRSIWYYTAGEIVVKTTAARRRSDDRRTTFRDQVFADLDRSELPRLAQAADRWASLTSADTYREGLAALVDGLLQSVQSQT